MEKMLKALFDYQGFEGNADLEGVIESVHNRYDSQVLRLDDLATVAAAGEMHSCFQGNLFGKRA